MPSNELAVRRMVKAEQLIAATSNSWDADYFLGRAIRVLTVGVD